MIEDSSDDEPLTRVNSGPKLYNIVPYDKLFKIKIVRKSGEKIKFEYLLKEGRPLPFETVLEGGVQFLFTRDLDIQMAAVDPSQLYTLISCQFIVVRYSETSYVIYVHIITIVICFRQIFVLCLAKAPLLSDQLSKDSKP